MYQHHLPMGRGLTNPGHRPLVVTPAAEAARFSLRIDAQRLDAASKAFGLELPATIGGMATSQGRMAVRLGPDEWYLIGPPSEQGTVERDFAELYASSVHSLVDIGDREVGIDVAGAGAAFALQSAIAFDVESMPVGSGCRTLIDKVQIILLREAATHFRIEVWRSFADHVWRLLETVGREIELGV